MTSWPYLFSKKKTFYTFTSSTTILVVCVIEKVIFVVVGVNVQEIKL